LLTNFVNEQGGQSFKKWMICTELWFLVFETIQLDDCSFGSQQGETILKGLKV